jgi:outer membrane protein assembly factor BamB
MDLKTGKIRWATQVLAGDNFLSGCGQGLNCPTGKIGPDYDFGSSSHIINVGGRDLVITGNKSATAYAMDPDTGKIVWQNKLGGGVLGRRGSIKASACRITSWTTSLRSRKTDDAGMRWTVIPSRFIQRSRASSLA